MDAVLRRFADEHGGIVLARDLAGIGFTWDGFKALADADGWTRLFRSAYLQPGRVADPVTRALAVQRLRGRHIIVSHMLAGFIHGFAVPQDPPFEFTAGGRSRCDIPGGRLYRVQLGDDDVMDVAGLAVTMPGRTAVDIMRTRSRDTAVIAVDAALHQGVISLDDIAGRLERIGGDKGTRAAWIAFARCDAKSESPTESKVRLIMWDRDLHARPQVVVVLADGTTYRTDFDLDGLYVECEGRKYHAPEDTYEADIRRFNALTNQLGPGQSAIRVTWREAFLHTDRAGRAIVAAHQAHLRRRTGHHA